MTDQSPAEKPISWPEWVRENRRAANESMSDHDWVQLEQAALGCTSGIENWPALKRAIQKVVAVKQSPRGHKIKVCTCKEAGCRYCDGGLQFCERCKGGEIELEQSCAERLAEQLAERDKQIDSTRAMLRLECTDLGASTKWTDILHLADVVEKHLCRPVRDRIRDLEEQLKQVQSTPAGSGGKPKITWKDLTASMLDKQLAVDAFMQVQTKTLNTWEAIVAAIKVILPEPKVRAPWGTEPWTRAGGDCVCETCGMTYYRHPVESGPGYGSCGDEVLMLVRLCNGKLVHL